MSKMAGTKTLVVFVLGMLFGACYVNADKIYQDCCKCANVCKSCVTEVKKECCSKEICKCVANEVCKCKNCECTNCPGQACPSKLQDELIKKN